MFPLSVLDLVPVKVNKTPADALADSLELAQHADALGYLRYWVAEHHNMVGIASAATSVVIGYLAAGTKNIRVGAGGVMLPNHSPLVIAEQFGTLESLYPNRIDLGLGRAPGTDQLTWQALRKNPRSSEQFPQDVLELQGYFEPVKENQSVQAVPGGNLNVPLWMLGSSLFGAQLAAQLGLPYAFASHFAPASLDQAFEQYRRLFKPSSQLTQPYAMPCISVIVADTDEQAEYLFTSMQQRFLGMIRNQRGKLLPPIDNIESCWDPMEKAQVQSMLSCAFIGSAATVKDKLQHFINRTQADELIVSAGIFDQSAKLHSYKLLADIGKQLMHA
ncbi:LLM class flavin-dependent oxidoreductase [Pseudocolwellia agarivorans]|uniref:LLM class flavin-dependent oxidoreductase n=1 Tax=Pseudocolwellia agarivorans TaxID=1911682 RepID=UPI000986EFAA|nr:LLM class flavin-dependent oxidoreductase [Pseudocolwellia agarivorans]